MFFRVLNIKNYCDSLVYRSTTVRTDRTVYKGNLKFEKSSGVSQSDMLIMLQHY